MNNVPENIHYEYDRNHILHPFAEFPRFLNKGSRFFDRAEGAYIYGVDGQKYLDGIGGLWCVNIGYGRHEMAQAITEQVFKLPFYNSFTDMSSVPASALATKLAQLAPADLNHVFFTTGGQRRSTLPFVLLTTTFRPTGNHPKN